jgi:hypothetical protein
VKVTLDRFGRVDALLDLTGMTLTSSFVDSAGIGGILLVFSADSCLNHVISPCAPVKTGEV